MVVGSVLYEALIDATGTGALADVLLSAADQAAGVDEIFGYWLDERGRVFVIVSSGHVGSSQSRADRYASQYHALDPLAGMAHYHGKDMRMARLAASDVHHSAYRRECYDHPGFAEKIAFARARGGRNFVLNFYRRKEQPVSSLDTLSELAELAFPLLRKHVDLARDDTDLPIVAKLEQRLTNTYPLLSRREREVCARTLTGMTAEAIGIDLSVSETTVLTYRRRAYERYNLSNSQEMLGRILF
ncbi:helix-turn-helix transcriptional regulator [Novosphingobium terrae]|uniref:helix-turn-helix transcriptional regulator n=1 Tax=Novosphingobium terrae TaxID=2726189 RepID=UPI00197E5DFC|nr:LuxR C-terminal-related transcriptional regulator [Novosphingobium terrae]